MLLVNKDATEALYTKQEFNIQKDHGLQYRKTISIKRLPFNQVTG